LGRADCSPGPRGLSAWVLRTIRMQAADRPPGPPELHTVLSSFEVNNGLSAIDPRTVRLEAIFLEKLCQKPHILNKPQRLADRPAQGPKLSAP
jgi:hypothetical protein